MDIVVFITASGRKEAGRIAQGLVEKKLAACVNMADPVFSVFSWKGRIERCREVLLIVKSTRGRLAALERFVKSVHSYEVPEIIALPIVGGNKDYLEWLHESVRKPA
jgi:periplasmic divalent cation tolerance protein